MKLIKQLHKIIEMGVLSEGASDILYHFTSSQNLINILSTNQFSLTAAIGSDSDFDINSEKHFFLSTTRSKSVGYNTGDVKIVLNGRMLKQNYKIKPVDYWQYSKNPKEYSKDDYLQMMRNSEQEDRIVSNDTVIENSSKYILEIHHLLNKTKVKKILDLSSQYKIPVYVYNNRKDFFNQTNPIKHSEIEYLEVESSDTYYGERFPHRIASFVAFNDEEAYQMILKYLGGEGDVFNTFEETFKKMSEQYFKIGANYASDAISVIKSAVHMISGKADKNSRFILGLLSNRMRKYDVKTFSELLEKKQWVGKKNLDSYRKDLFGYIYNVMDNQLSDDLDYYFSDYIEIGGKYYNKMYESEEFMAIIYSYFKKLSIAIKEIVYHKNYDVFEHSFYFDKGYIGDRFDLKEINVWDKLDITDITDRYDMNSKDGLNNRVKTIFERLIMVGFSSESKDKLDSLKKEYLNSLK